MLMTAHGWCGCKRRRKSVSGSLSKHSFFYSNIQANMNRQHLQYCTLFSHTGCNTQITAPRLTTQHNTTQHNTTQHNTTQHNTTQHNTTRHATTYRIVRFFVTHSSVLFICSVCQSKPDIACIALKYDTDIHLPYSSFVIIACSAILDRLLSTVLFLLCVPLCRRPFRCRGKSQNGNRR
jgi:hypothetical protein